MIIRILSNGKSFKGAAAYLTHDPDADTSKRVEWTHTLNLAHDNVPCAVDEMVWTARDAELLKQEAGVRAGGRATETPVKHLSLNWAPEDKPTPEHMIETTQEFLRHMNWHEHQAIIVAHNDKSYAHAHVLLNCVHPETGLKLDDGFEQRRAQKWAENYEREQGHIYCAQRLLAPEEREANMPRNMWAAFHENEKEFSRSENSLRQKEGIIVDEEQNRRNAEWKILKELQRTERTDFFAEGKIEFSQLRLSIYREVREEFRDRWADFYAARKEGADPEKLATLKAELVADQKAVLDTRRDEACNELRESRNVRYRELLDDQRAVRADLRQRQEAGLDNSLFFQQLEDGRSTATTGFRVAADEAAMPHDGRQAAAQAERAIDHSGNDVGETISAPRDDSDVGLKVGVSVGSFLDSLFFDPKSLSLRNSVIA
jgi:hypothetical protein